MPVAECVAMLKSSKFNEFLSVGTTDLTLYGEESLVKMRMCSMGGGSRTKLIYHTQSVGKICIMLCATQQYVAGDHPGLSRARPNTLTSESFRERPRWQTACVKVAGDRPTPEKALLDCLLIGYMM